MKNALLIICLCFGNTWSFAQSEDEKPSTKKISISGKLTDQDTGDPILYGSVALFRNEKIIDGIETDLDGNYVFYVDTPGIYDLEASYVGYHSKKMKDIMVETRKGIIIDIQIEEGDTLQEGIVISCGPLIDIDQPASGDTITAKQIKDLPTKNITAIASQPCTHQTTNDNEVKIRNSTSTETYYYIDGVRVNAKHLKKESKPKKLKQLLHKIKRKLKSQ